MAVMQAYLTRRKKDKIFAVYDLNIVLRWAGHWVEDDKKVCFLLMQRTLSFSLQQNVPV